MGGRGRGALRGRVPGARLCPTHGRGGGGAGRAGLPAGRRRPPFPSPPRAAGDNECLCESVCPREAGRAAGSQCVPACLCAVTRPGPSAEPPPRGRGEPPGPPGRAPRRDPPTATHPAGPGSLAGRAAPASCDSPARCQEPGGEGERAEGGRQGGGRAAPPRTQTRSHGGGASAAGTWDTPPECPQFPPLPLPRHLARPPALPEPTEPRRPPHRPPSVSVRTE